MIKNKLIIVLVLCIGISSTISLASQQPSGLAEWFYNRGTSLWQAGVQKASQAKLYAASFIPQSFVDTIAKWSIQKKTAVVTAIIAALALLYDKDAVMQMTSDAYDKAPKTAIGASMAAVGGGMLAKTLGKKMSSNPITVQGFENILLKSQSENNLKEVIEALKKSYSEPDSITNKNLHTAIHNLFVKELNTIIGQKPNLEDKMKFIQKRFDKLDSLSENSVYKQNRTDYIRALNTLSWGTIKSRSLAQSLSR